MDWIIIMDHRTGGKWIVFLGIVHTTPEEFENEAFSLKSHQMFFVHTTPGEFKNATITVHFGFVFEKNSIRGIT